MIFKEPHAYCNPGPRISPNDAHPWDNLLYQIQKAKLFSFIHCEGQTDRHSQTFMATGPLWPDPEAPLHPTCDTIRSLQSILNGNIAIWCGSCLAKAWKENVIGTNVQSISDNGEMRCLHRAQRILKGDTQPSHSLFTLLPSGKTYRVSAAVPPDYGAASFLKLFDSLTHPPQSTIVNSILVHHKGTITYIWFTTMCCRMRNKSFNNPKWSLWLQREQLQLEFNRALLA